MHIYTAKSLGGGHFLLNEVPLYTASGWVHGGHLGTGVTRK